ncbi:dihydrofolate reductase family protein [Mycoplasma sp. P36-A1]|uniref:dihydrofolate reductase family protein n=1 Tax=Mycoplasma sp. P36-A1 TaxID=3252900 RepID=UPI003C2ABC89
MNRPYIFCHMLTSLDGKIMGNYMNTKEAESASNDFYNIAFGKNAYYKHQGWLSGRITTDDNFTFYEKPLLDLNAKEVVKGDFIATTAASMYYVSIDIHGKLGWKSNILTYNDTKAHIIELLCETTSNEYKDFLRKLNISYIIAGEDTLDIEQAMIKLKDLFKIETLMLGGGGVLNYTFMDAGMCDELSIVMCAAADGNSTTPPLFLDKSNNDNQAFTFSLKEVKMLNNSNIWLRYLVNK